jgi:putative acetyltransferase
MTDLPADLQIRPVEADDADALHALRQMPSILAQNPPLPGAPREVTRELIENLPPTTLKIVATVGATLVGEADLQVGRNRRAHRATLGISVHDAWQGRGIGTQLMAALIDAADHWYGLRRIELRVFAGNEAALALYRKFGFEIEVTQRAAVLRDGFLIDVHIMGRVREPIAYMTTGSLKGEPQ